MASRLKITASEPRYINSQIQVAVTDKFPSKLSQKHSTSNQIFEPNIPQMLKPIISTIMPQSLVSGHSDISGLRISTILKNKSHKMVHYLSNAPLKITNHPITLPTHSYT